MEIKFTFSEGKVDVLLSGEMDTPATEEIQPKIDELLTHSDCEIVLDCSQLSYIASSGLRLLITIHKRCAANGGHMILKNLSGNVMEIISITNFDKVFDIR